MFFFFRNGLQGGFRPQGPAMAQTLFFNGVLLVVLGLAIIANPALLAYIVAGLLIAVGVMMLLAWSRTRR